MLGKRGVQISQSSPNRHCFLVRCMNIERAPNLLCVAVSDCNAAHRSPKRGEKWELVKTNPPPPPLAAPLFGLTNRTSVRASGPRSLRSRILPRFARRSHQGGCRWGANFWQQPQSTRVKIILTGVIGGSYRPSQLVEKCVESFLRIAPCVDRQTWGGHALW